VKRILIVANRTLCEQHLLDEVHRRRAESAAVSFHVLVPASHPSTGVWTDAQAAREASERLEEMLDVLAMGGIGATGEIGDPSPVMAVDDLLRREQFDEIIVSTLPAGMSRWLGQNAVRRIRNNTGLPVTHVMAERVLTGT
jgi:hypothetical protein